VLKQNGWGTRLESEDWAGLGIDYPIYVVWGGEWEAKNQLRKEKKKEGAGETGQRVEGL